MEFLFQTSPNFRGVTDEFEFNAIDQKIALRNIIHFWDNSGIQPEEGEAFLYVYLNIESNDEYTNLGDFSQSLDGSYRFLYSNSDDHLNSIVGKEFLSLSNASNEIMILEKLLNKIYQHKFS